MATQCPKDFNDDLPGRIVKVTTAYYSIYPLLVISGFPRVQPPKMFDVASVDLWEGYLGLIYFIINLVVDLNKPKQLLSTDQNLIAEMTKFTLAYSKIDEADSLVTIMNGGARNKKYHMKGGDRFDDMNKDQLIAEILKSSKIVEILRKSAKDTNIKTIQAHLQLANEDSLRELCRKHLLPPTSTGEAGTGGTDGVTARPLVHVRGLPSVKPDRTPEEITAETLAYARRSAAEQNGLRQRGRTSVQGRLIKLSQNDQVLQDVQELINAIEAQLHNDIIQISQLEAYNKLAEAVAENETLTTGRSKVSRINLTITELQLSNPTRTLIHNVLGTFNQTPLGRELAGTRRNIVIARDDALFNMGAMLTQGCLPVVGGGTVGIIGLRIMAEQIRNAEQARAAEAAAAALRLAGQGFFERVGGNLGAIFSDPTGAVVGLSHNTASLVTKIICGGCGGMCSGCFSGCVGMTPTALVSTTAGIAGVGCASIVTAGGCAYATSLMIRRQRLLRTSQQSLNAVELFINRLRQTFLRAAVNKYNDDMKNAITIARQRLGSIREKSALEAFITDLLSLYRVDNVSEAFNIHFNAIVREVINDHARQGPGGIMMTVPGDEQNLMLVEIGKLREKSASSISNAVRTFEAGIITDRETAIAQFQALRNGTYSVTNAAAAGLSTAATFSLRAAGAAVTGGLGATAAFAAPSAFAAVQHGINAAQTRATNHVTAAEAREMAAAQARVEKAERAQRLAGLYSKAEAIERSLAARPAAPAAAAAARPAAAAARPAEEMPVDPSGAAAQPQQQQPQAQPADSPSGESKTKGGKRKTRRSNLNKRKTRKSRR